MNLTLEEKEAYYKYLIEHIHLVQKGMLLVGMTRKDEDLLGRIHDHDRSKFCGPEAEGYQLLHAGKHKIDKACAVIAKHAIFTHVITNPHHPEYHAEKVYMPDNFNSYTLPSQIVDATAMPTTYIREMVCDWCAVSIYKGTSLRDWASRMVNKRWQFTDEQIDTIYDTITILKKD